MSAAIILGVAMVTVVYVAAIMVCFLYIRRCVRLTAMYLFIYSLRHRGSTHCTTNIQNMYTCICV